MTSQLEKTGAFAPAELYAQVQQFYSRQMGLLDDGIVDAWTDTFTDDAVFEDTAVPEPLYGKEAIRTSVTARVEQIKAERLEFRHWFGMLNVETQPDGSVRTRYYALAISTPRGGKINVRGNVVGRDHLVPDGSGWLVRHRFVRLDGVED
nr:nuclear transport factor 2 family protein [Kibdelosporangium sp. MJ126-NF4]CEL20577.1 hypothetical protein [Kibdelosporangium sp. MJ126-NF4]CTQ89488.1 hypothetical protein [Kibdelosporangium sp. MJ126-NF4]